MALVDDFKARFPEFSTTVADQYVPIYEGLWTCYYGGEYVGCGVEIVLNLLAHLITLETAPGNDSVKSTQSKSVGSVSVTYGSEYASGSQRDTFLRSTKYGARVLFLTRKRTGGFFV